eukprot:scaffold139650_cov18-Tisochrysis_lutea.AAC.1
MSALCPIAAFYRRFILFIAAIISMRLCQAINSQADSMQVREGKGYKAVASEVLYRTNGCQRLTASHPVDQLQWIQWIS